MANEPRLHRGDIWLVDFGADPHDPEQAFVRPAVIVSDDRLHHPNLRMVIVGSGDLHDSRDRVACGGLA